MQFKVKFKPHVLLGWPVCFLTWSITFENCLKAKVRTFSHIFPMQLHFRLMFPRSRNLRLDISTTIMESFRKGPKWELEFWPRHLLPLSSFLSFSPTLALFRHLEGTTGDRLSPERQLLWWEWAFLGGFRPWTLCVGILHRALRYGIYSLCFCATSRSLEARVFPYEPFCFFRTWEFPPDVFNVMMFSRCGLLIS